MHLRPGFVPKILCVGLGLGFAAAFQNFSVLPLERLKLARLDAAIPAAHAAGGDIRLVAPRKPASLEQPVLAVPQSGSDLSSVGQDWFTRQAKLLTNGEDEKLMKSVNRNLQRGLNDSVSVFGNAESSAAAQEDESALVPTIRVTAFNRVEFGSSESARLSCLVNGSSLQLDLSRALNESMNVNVHHESSTNSNTLQLQYVW